MPFNIFSDVFLSNLCALVSLVVVAAVVCWVVPFWLSPCRVLGRGELRRPDRYMFESERRDPTNHKFIRLHSPLVLFLSRRQAEQEDNGARHKARNA